MDSRAIGTSGVSLSAVGLGGFELGPIDGAAPDVDNAVAVIEECLHSGIDWLDTSENYNASANESLIGAALGHISERFAIASKVAPRAAITGGGSGFRHDQVHGAARESLTRLDRDVIDVYMLHWPDDTGVPLEETWGAMGELVEQGLVRAVGLSNYELADIEKCHEQRRVDVLETGLSLIDYLDDREMIRRCGELGIAVLIYEPVASGILTNRSLEEVRAIWTGPWLESSFYKRLLSPGKGERSAAVTEGIKPIAQELGVTVAQVAIAWVLHQPGVTSAIAGSRDGRHVHENALAGDLDLTGYIERLEALIPLGPAFA